MPYFQSRNLGNEIFHNPIENLNIKFLPLIVRFSDKTK